MRVRVRVCICRCRSIVFIYTWQNHVARSDTHTHINDGINKKEYTRVYKKKKRQKNHQASFSFGYRENFRARFPKAHEMTIGYEKKVKPRKANSTSKKKIKTTTRSPSLFPQNTFAVTLRMRSLHFSWNVFVFRMRNKIRMGNVQSEWCTE